jgi:hypothetical protein
MAEERLQNLVSTVVTVHSFIAKVDTYAQTQGHIKLQVQI